MKQLLTALVISIISLSAQAYNAQSKTITIGTTVGDFADLVKGGIAPELEKRGYKVKLVEFTDYVRPNLALAEGDLDINIFQHKPYLEEFSSEKNLKLTAIAQVPTAPLGLYAGRSKSLNQVKAGSTVAVPNDPTNLARALVILADIGWVQLNGKIDPLKVTVSDIQKYGINIKIVQLEAAQLPRALGDVDFAIINGNYATSSGISLTSALASERSDAYINWAVSRSSDVNIDYVKAVREVIHSSQLKQFAATRFPGYKQPEQWRKASNTK